MESLNLENYEVLYFEAIHCSMNQIKNVLEELPHHISDIDTLIKLKEILAVQLNKEKMRGVDYKDSDLLENSPTSNSNQRCQDSLDYSV